LIAVRTGSEAIHAVDIALTEVVLELWTIARATKWEEVASAGEMIGMNP
jgi:hypothetical protein